MCNACGFPARPGVWTEAGARTPADRLRLRLSQANALNRLLNPCGLSARDGGHVPGILLSTPAGSIRLVKDLPELWKAAEELLGRSIDPLDLPDARSAPTLFDR
jgi:hypothetical protein